MHESYVGEVERVHFEPALESLVWIEKLGLSIPLDDVEQAEYA